MGTRSFRVSHSFLLENKPMTRGCLVIKGQSFVVEHIGTQGIFNSFNLLFNASLEGCWSSSGNQIASSS
jgi:hypothetical protein